MTNNTTELVFILDRSGSMAGLEGDTVGGFNSMLRKQKAQPGKAYVTTVLFDHLTETVHDRLPIEEVPELTEKDYFVRGSTALLDAVGKTVEHISSIHHYARPEDVPAKTMFVITTDGMENASREYSYDRLKALIEEKKALGWEFIFLGANIDAAKEAARFGIAADRAVRFKSDSQGTALNYSVISDAVACARACPNGSLPKSWKSRIEDDVKKRGN